MKYCFFLIFLIPIVLFSQENEEVTSNDVKISAFQNTEALLIIQQAILHKKYNNPEVSLGYFNYKAYRKIIVSADPNKISASIDSVFQTKNNIRNFIHLDSSNYKFKKELEKHHLYITEKISEHSFKQGKKQNEHILALRMAGFENPVYELLKVNIQDFSVYKKHYTIAGTKYLNPIAEKGPELYVYKLLDTITKTGRKAVRVYFEPKEKLSSIGLKGVLSLDLVSFAVVDFVTEFKGEVLINASQKFKFIKADNGWFPIEAMVEISNGENKKGVRFFNRLLDFDAASKKSNKWEYSAKQSPSDVVFLRAKTSLFDIQINHALEIEKSSSVISIASDANKKKNYFWELYRREHVTRRDSNTYVLIDSISKADNVERKIDVARNLLKGFYPLSFLNLDLGKIINLNNYEGLRIGLGGITNARFSEKFRIESYVAYGTKDAAIKYKAGAAFRLNMFANTWMGLNYTNDIHESAGIDFILKGTSFSPINPRNLNLSHFYKFKTWEAYLVHDIQPNFTAKLNLTAGSYKSVFYYKYISNKKLLSDYHLTLATVAFNYSPNSEYLSSPIGKIRVKNGYPQYTLQLRKSMSHVAKSDFGFAQVNFKVEHQLKPLKKGVTHLLLIGGLTFGETPLSHLYNATPNYTYKNPYRKRITFGGKNSFETMGYNEFISDRYVMFQFKHFLEPFHLSNLFKPHLSIITRFGIGGMRSPMNQVGVQFKTMEKGYLESGLEINRLFKGFGFSAFYRLGAYRLEDWSDNLAVKLTYRLSLGF
ncbi:MAG: hypothetical protein COB98_11925 [Flavobacteriaceae bacterium]|nr:MAG: hypothetical protein COB98_11925 [Flavobacteriaceae bacterium]